MRVDTYMLLLLLFIYYSADESTVLTVLGLALHGRTNIAGHTFFETTIQALFTEN
jgi:hypothetical protein